MGPLRKYGNEQFLKNTIKTTNSQKQPPNNNKKKHGTGYLVAFPKVTKSLNHQLQQQQEQQQNHKTNNNVVIVCTSQLAHQHGPAECAKRLNKVLLHGFCVLNKVLLNEFCVSQELQEHLQDPQEHLQDLQEHL